MEVFLAQAIQSTEASFWASLFSRSNHATLISAAVAGIAAYFTYKLFKTAKKHFSHERTSSFIERYNTPEFCELRSRVDQFLYVTERMKTTLDRGRVYRDLFLSNHLDDIRFRHQLWTFVMLFNEIGQAWKKSYIDNDVINNFDRLIPRYIRRLKPYINNVHLNFNFPLPRLDNYTYRRSWISSLMHKIRAWLYPEKYKQVLFQGFYYAYRRLGQRKCVEPADLHYLDLDHEDNYLPLKDALYNIRFKPYNTYPQYPETVIGRIVMERPTEWPDEFIS